MKLYVKNMVSTRCKMLVSAELRKLKIGVVKIELGVIETIKDLKKETIKQIGESLATWDLHLIEDKNDILVEKVKTILIKMIQTGEDMPKKKFSLVLSTKLGYDYTYISNVFSKTLNTTIQQFIIKLKIERVKELLQSNQFNLTEISYMLQYSSVAHLSKQFKKTTGLTVSDYRINKVFGRISLEKVGVRQNISLKV